jgi:POT family proton-dependent oligopeptide transporter
MMGLYFAATGLGNKVAGIIGESSQAERIEIELAAEKDQLSRFVANEEAEEVFENNKAFTIETQVYKDSSGEIIFEEVNTGQKINSIFTYESENSKSELLKRIQPYNATADDKLLTFLKFDYKEGNYVGSINVDQFQTDLEFNTFAGIIVFTVAFGVLVILLLKPLKRLTHGAEEKEVEKLEAEGFEIADDEVK